MTQLTRTSSNFRLAGSLACQSANILVLGKSSLSFTGLDAGLNIFIQVQDDISDNITLIASATTSFAGGEFRSGKNNQVNLYFNGSFAGGENGFDGSNIICQTGSTCNISCWNNACLNTVL